MAAMNFEFDALPTSCCICCSNVRKPLKKQRVELNDTVKDSLKGRYDASVLVGNWYDRRSNYLPPADDWVTSYDTSYVCKTNWNLHKDRQAMVDNKINVERGLGLDFLIKHRGDHFKNNYTTTNELFFRHFPKGLCGPRIRTYSSRKNLWLPESNLSKNYGNLTHLFPPEPTVECGCQLPEPEQKRFPKPIGDFNTPQLCHLDIDPDLPFKPHAVKTNQIAIK